MVVDNPESVLAIGELAKRKAIKGAGMFGKEKRLKFPKKERVGPGSYEKFSVFGVPGEETK